MEITLENGKVVRVVKLPLGKYAELLQAFQELPKHFKEFQNFKDATNEQFIQMIPTLLGSCMPDVVRVIKIATELTEEEVQALGLAEAAEILVAIYKVNNYQAVYEKIKKVLARPAQTQDQTQSDPLNLKPID